MTLLRPTYKQAKAWAEYQRNLPYGHAPTDKGTWLRRCQEFARKCPGAAPFGASANIAWASIPDAHQFAMKDAKPGMIGYASNMSGGKPTGAGHSFFIIENGYCYSVDIKRAGQVDICHISAFQSQWGMTLLGAIDWTPSGKLGLAIPAPKPPVTLPVVDLSVVIVAAKRDPQRPTGGITPGASDDVLRVEKALIKVGLLQSRWADGSYGLKTREAYANWQRRTVPGPHDGIPGSVSLNALARKTGLFKVVA